MLKEVLPRKLQAAYPSQAARGVRLVQEPCPAEHPGWLEPFRALLAVTVLRSQLMGTVWQRCCQTESEMPLQLLPHVPAPSKKIFAFFGFPGYQVYVSMQRERLNTDLNLCLLSCLAPRKCKVKVHRQKEGAPTCCCRKASDSCTRF